MNNTVLAIAPVPGGMVAGGTFTAADGAPANRVARWNGSAWSALGSGVDDEVHALMRLAPSGDIIAAGKFLNAGGAPASRIARWNGSAWSTLGSGLDGPAYALAQLANGDIVVAGAFTTAGGVSCNRIARWNRAWTVSSWRFAPSRTASCSSEEASRRREERAPAGSPAGTGRRGRRLERE
jgi:hypothetical protein